MPTAACAKLGSSGPHPPPAPPPAAPANSLFELTSAIGKLSTKAGAAAIVPETGKGNLTLAPSGEATLYDSLSRVLFSSGTANKGAAPYSLVLKATGELSVQDNTGKILWDANTTGARGGVLRPAAAAQAGALLTD